MTIHPTAAAALKHLTTMGVIAALRQRPRWTFDVDDNAQPGDPYDFDHAPPDFVETDDLPGGRRQGVERHNLKARANLRAAADMTSAAIDANAARALCWAQFMAEHTPHDYAVIEVREGWVWVRGSDLTDEVEIAAYSRKPPVEETAIEFTRTLPGTFHMRLVQRHATTKLSRNDAVSSKLLARLGAWRDFLTRDAQATPTEGR